jgi:hypothetical protein
MRRWADFALDLDVPPIQQRSTYNDSLPNLLPVILRVTGASGKKISMDTPLYPYQITYILSKLFRMSGYRVKCFPDNATFGSLIAEWKRQVVLRRQESRRIGY